MAFPAKKQPAFDAEAYLAWEDQQQERHEYINGEVFAMVGVRQAHGTATINWAVALRRELAGTPCRVFVEAVKTRVEADNAFFYPDVAVTCDSSDRRTPQYISHPTLLVEILSESTAAFDRGDKFAAYRKLESLKEYGILDLKAKRLEVFRRDETNHWVLYEFGPGEVVDFPSLAVKVAMDEILHDTEEPPEPLENV